MLRECLPIIVIALIAIVALSWTVMALRRSLERERRLARIDDLTGIRNARAFHEAAGAEIERARRYQHPFTVAAVDLGNRVGDELVQAAAAMVRGALRATDYVARLGRDEFIAILPETSGAAARVVLEKLRASLSELRGADGNATPAPTIGGVTFLNPPRAVDEIIRATDERIADARTTGTISHVTWNAAPPPTER